MSQYFAVHPENPQARLIQQAVQILRQGGVMVYPTDSGYALACRIGDKNAMERICQIREVDKDHHFTLMCRDLSELATYARVNNQAFRLLKNNTPGHYTFILVATKEVPKRLLNARRKTIGIRVSDDPITMALTESLGEPLMSTSLVMKGEEFAESDPYEIRWRLEHAVDVIIDGGHRGEEPTTVVDMSGDEIEILRAGAGDVGPFAG
ncbi:L-threonylcarbamoyladenylate synthase [Pseudidiomarina taiwanensis]|uniref:Threonylcarbamoyl-AMP synthase n=1 Tax=Pseudidiomarina taiwanensis TaxID=337250 RepID=A0A432ZMC5_9GAMM|nr:L-threonylcarbamoyladenylate synthase [Pseudidiomarina taiwanensis]RUO79024.1 threonylcarbamoyl-AMP synthase [Pseudidiomarina taiwanensis]